MAKPYEAVVSKAGLELFQDSFLRYLDDSGFDHMGVGGRLGGMTAHEFRRDDHRISLSVSQEGQSHYRVVVHSDTTPVEPLVLDALTESIADFLEPFCQTSDEEFQNRLTSLIKDLRDAFERVLVEDD